MNVSTATPRFIIVVQLAYLGLIGVSILKLYYACMVYRHSVTIKCLILFTCIVGINRV